MDSNYMEATSQNVLRPQVAPQGKRFDEWITFSSPLWQRRAAVQLTRYLHLETGYRQDLDESITAWKENRTTVFSIADDVILRNGNERHALVGILTFHIFDDNPVLYHCYLHPFYRHKGIMNRTWNKIKIKFERFEIEEPISYSMSGFMRKVDCSHILPST